MNNTILEMLKTRRSIRKYQTRQIPDSALQSITEAGTYAPSAGGSQSSVIVAVQNEELIAKLSRMNAAVMGADMDPYYGAPTLTIVLGDGSKSNFLQDGSCALMNMMIAAHSLGLGSCWIDREREMFASPEGQDLLKAWELPQNLVGVGALSLGYPRRETNGSVCAKKRFHSHDKIGVLILSLHPFYGSGVAVAVSSE